MGCNLPATPTENWNRERKFGINFALVLLAPISDAKLILIKINGII